MANPWDNDPVVGGKTTSPAEFAQVYGAAAERAAKTLGVDPKVLLGQWGLETGWGKSIIPGTNNLGNIKDFSGSGTSAVDSMTGSKDKYRTYATPEEFADDFASLIQRKYPNAVGAKDPLAFATALKAGGYAEDPRYVDKVAQATRMAGTTQNPVVAAVGKAVESVIPSAQAAGNPWDNDPVVEATPAKQEGGGAAFGVFAPGRRQAKNNTPNASDAIIMGGARGVKDVIDTGAQLLSRVAGPEEAARVQAMNDAGKAEFKAEYGDSGLASMGRFGGQTVATLPVGGILGRGVRAASEIPVVSQYAGPVLNRLATALETSGARTGAAPTTIPGAAGNMLLRMAGGAGTGYAGASLVNPDSGGMGAAMGGLFPLASKVVGAGGNALGAAVRPFYGAGQDRIAGDALRRFATNPLEARAALNAASEVVPGSAPIAAAAAGDEGIAALSRAMQNSSPEYAANLSARQTAQNQARTAALEDIAGNTGKIDLAKQRRDELTGPMREQVLDAAGQVPSDGILRSIDRQLADPNNAGKLSQQALLQFRDRIAQFSEGGAINARALYAIRKDINDVLGGKLQGEAGNIRYAAGQLNSVKGMIDDAIDQASRRVAPAGQASGATASTSREVAPFTPSTELGQVRQGQLVPQRGQQVGPAGTPVVDDGITATAARPTWRGYLETYANESVPIRQMEKLDEILKSVQTGTVDSQGGLILSAAKLNNLLKNQGSDLAKDLSKQQLDILRRIQADLNASQLSNNVGRAVGSNTVQNLAQNQLLESTLGRAIGGSTAATSTLGRLLQLPYGAANKQIQERLGNALLNPQEAARLLQDPANNALLQALQRPAALGYKTVPAITSGQ